MNIIETTLPDINVENLDSSKVRLADIIIENINPLFDEVQQERKKEFNEKVGTYTQLKNTVASNKTEPEKLFGQYKRKQKIRKLLERIDKMVSLGIATDGKLKQETVILLKIIDKLPDEKLDYHLKDTANTITKRFPG